jgi:hypothetical protein
VNENRDRPELLVAVSFVGAFVTAQILKRIATR